MVLMSNFHSRGSMPVRFSAAASTGAASIDLAEAKRELMSLCVDGATLPSVPREIVVSGYQQFSIAEGRALLRRWSTPDQQRALIELTLNGQFRCEPEEARCLVHPLLAVLMTEKPLKLPPGFQQRYPNLSIVLGLSGRERLDRLKAVLQEIGRPFFEAERHAFDDSPYGLLPAVDEILARC